MCELLTNMFDWNKLNEFENIDNELIHANSLDHSNHLHNFPGFINRSLFNTPTCHCLPHIDILFVQSSIMKWSWHHWNPFVRLNCANPFSIPFVSTFFFPYRGSFEIKLVHCHSMDSCGAAAAFVEFRVCSSAFRIGACVQRFALTQTAPHIDPNENE